MSEFKKYLKAHFLVPIIYWLIVLLCNLMFFGFDKSPRELFLALFFITLPWSIIGGFFILGALHLGDEKSIIIIFMMCATLNALLYYFVARPKTEIK